VSQIAGNLLSNAIKFTAAGGRIRVCAARGAEQPELLEIAVADTGQGIAPHALPHVFERLYQDRQALSGSRKGLGLGLYICKELVGLLGGRIWVQSGVGEGSRFAFTLPVYATERLLRGHLLAERAASLLIVALGTPGEGVVRGSCEELTREVHAALPRLVWNQCDVVLPRRRSAGGERLAVVAQTDGRGAQAMAARFERALAELRARLADPCPIALRCHELGPPHTPLDKLAAQIDALLELSA
jgi:hypothetical protein